MKPLYLYGPPASGKSTLAKQLAADFHASAIDLDEEISRRAGMPIPAIFASLGEHAFRQMESDALRDAKAQVVALGGGALLDEANRHFAEQSGFVAVIDASDEEIARRIALSGGTRPLGNKAAERRAHYASFKHHIGHDTRVMLPALLSGDIAVPPSKSHVHRLLIANFLATRKPSPQSCANECADIAATRRCIAALADAAARATDSAVLDCGESGSTLRFMAPVAAALGIKAEFVRRGRLAARPAMEYDKLESGRHVLPGDISSQFVTGLLFALPLLDGDSEIAFSSPLESRGYVDMTLDVVRSCGITITETSGGFNIPGRQKYRESPQPAEGDWSGAAFWLAANAIGSSIRVTNLSRNSRQPDSRIADMIAAIQSPANALVREIDISPCPDLYPALAVVAAATPGKTRFINAGRLRIKESDRIAAMEALLAELGAEANSTGDTAAILGSVAPFSACEIDPCNDHRIAMAAAIASIRADGPVLIRNASCTAKSYPDFFRTFTALS